MLAGSPVDELSVNVVAPLVTSAASVVLMLLSKVKEVMRGLR
jgi:hypothetical protein